MRLVEFESALDESVETAVAGILEAVRTRGDAALVEFTTRFDRWTPRAPAELDVPLAQARAALDALPRTEREALEVAAARIRTYHERQRQESWRVREADGTELGQQVTPLDRVGLSAGAGYRLGTLCVGLRHGVGLAQAFFGTRPLFVIDEPSAGFDPAERL